MVFHWFFKLIIYTNLSSYLLFWFLLTFLFLFLFFKNKFIIIFIILINFIAFTYFLLGIL